MNRFLKKGVSTLDWIKFFNRSIIFIFKFRKTWKFRNFSIDTFYERRSILTLLPFSFNCRVKIDTYSLNVFQSFSVHWVFSVVIFLLNVNENECFFLHRIQFAQWVDRFCQYDFELIDKLMNLWVELSLCATLSETPHPNVKIVINHVTSFRETERKPN